MTQLHEKKNYKNNFTTLQIRPFLIYVTFFLANYSQPSGFDFAE